MITSKFTKENAAKLIGSRRALKTDPTKIFGYSRIIDKIGRASCRERV